MWITACSSVHTVSDLGFHCFEKRSMVVSSLGQFIKEEVETFISLLYF